MTDWIDEIESQADETSPYYLPRLIAEIRQLRSRCGGHHREATPSQGETLRALIGKWRTGAAFVRQRIGALRKTQNETLALLMEAEAERLEKCVAELEAALAQPAPSALSRIHDEIDAESQPAPETTQEPLPKYAVLLTRDEDGDVIATAPELDGCITHGATVAEAVRNAVEAQALWIEAATANGSFPAQPSTEVAILSALKNSGIDTSCGACMEVAFTGVTTNAHTCHQPSPEVAALVESLCVSLHDAHNELLRLQGITEGLDRYDWPEWSGPANSIRHAERLLGKPLSKTSLRAADAPLAPEPEPCEVRPMQAVDSCSRGTFGCVRAHLKDAEPEQEQP